MGQTVCFVSTQASYARGDTVTPLWCMVAQALGCLVLCGGAVVMWDATALVSAVAAAYAVATLAVVCCCSSGSLGARPGLLAGSARPACGSRPAWR